MDKLRAMNTFVRVARREAFWRSRNEMNTTQSAVSKQVALLERELGVKLLTRTTRTTRSLALTEEGARYFERVRRLLAEIAWIEGDCSGEQQLTGCLRVAASTR